MATLREYLSRRPRSEQRASIHEDHTRIVLLEGDMDQEEFERMADVANLEKKLDTLISWAIRATFAGATAAVSLTLNLIKSFGGF